MEVYKREIQFKDGNRNVVNLKIKINKEGVFSISGDISSCGGQIYDEILPANIYQEKLINYWKKYHLNDMHAGTLKQEKALDRWYLTYNRDVGYDRKVEYLKSINMYNDNGYRYGTSWLKRELSHNFEKKIDNLCNKIMEIESDNVSGKEIKDLTEEEMGKYLSVYSKRQVAFAICLNLHESELQEVKELTPYYNLFYGGIDYFVGTYDEAEEVSREYLEDDIDFWKSLVSNNSTTLGFDDWIEEVILNDGPGQILNFWDGTSEYIAVKNVEFFICRR